jgi:hypothetical protein
MSPDFRELRSYGGYSGNLPHKTSPGLLAVLSSTTGAGPYAARLYTSALAQPNNDLSDGSGGFTVYEMLYADTSKTGDVSQLPLSFFAPGVGRFFSRSSLSDPDAYFMSAENIPYNFDHYGNDEGDVRLYHGESCLVCPSAYRGDAFRGEGGTPAYSTYLLDGKGQSGTNRNNQILYTIESQSGWSAVAMRLESSYSGGSYDETVIEDQMPLDYLIREAVHVRPGILVVRDLVHRRHSETLQGLWHLGPMGTVQTLGGGAYQVGGLNINSFSSVQVATTFMPDTDGNGAVIGTLMQDAVDADGEVELVRVFSDAATAVSYAGGVVKLSTGQCVKFSSGTVSVDNC